MLSLRGAAFSSGSAALERWQIRAASEFSDFAPGWQRLNKSLGSNPLLHPDFVVPLLQHFGNTHVRLAILGDPADPEAMALLEPGRRLSWRTFQPSQAPVGLWLNRPGTDTERLCRQLLGALPGLCVSLSVTRQDPHLFPRPESSARLSTLSHIETAQVKLGGTFADYWKARDSKLRQETNRRLKRLQSAGITPELDLVTDPTQVSAAVAEFGRIESAGWKGREGTAVHADNAQGKFYMEMLGAFSVRAMGRVYRLRFNDRTAAMQLCIEDGDALVFLKTTYDEEFRNSAPGILMQKAIFEQVFEEGRITRIEFYGRTGEPQIKWCDNRVRTIYHVNYYRWEWLPRLKELYATYKGSEIDSAADDEEAKSKMQLKANAYESLDSLPAGYQRLFEQGHGRRFFVSLPWFKHFSRHLASLGQSLRIYGLETLNGDAQPVGALLMSHPPLVGGMRARKICAAATYYTPSFGPLIDPRRTDVGACVKQLAGAVANDSKSWDVIDFFPLDRSDVSYDALLAGLREHGLIADTYFHSGNWYLDVAGRTFGQYVESVPSALQNTLRRKRRQLDRNSTVRTVIVTRPDEAITAIADYERVYAASWKKPEPFPEFIRGLAHVCAENGWLRLGLLYLDERPVAAQIWIVYEGVASIYKLAYDQAFMRLSAGSVLTAVLLQRVIDVDHVMIVDYLTGDDPYKKDWMSHRAERWGIIAFNPRTARGMMAAGHHFARRALRRGLRTVFGTVPEIANRRRQS